MYLKVIMAPQNNVLFFLVTVLVLGYAGAQNLTDSDLEQLLENIFGDEHPNWQCANVKPDLPGCYECFPCHHSIISHYRSQQEKIGELMITSPACQDSQVCCIAQSVLLGLRSGEDCGKRVETGHRRKAPRAVLEGEYPWQGFVYEDKSGVRTLLCGATYIHEGSKALLTTASCVRGKQPRSLHVSFSIPPGKDNMVRVNTVTPHKDFNPDKQLNDIAVIKLAANAPRHVAPVCMPQVAPQHAISCRAVASNQYLINTHIPKTSVCLKSLGALHRSKMCATTLRGDFEPQVGSGLFCEIQHEKNPSFVMYGLALKTDEESVTTYTNLTDFITWVYSKVDG